MLVLAALLALLVGALLLRSSQKRRQAMGLPNGDVFYQDHSGQPMPAEILTSKEWNLRGKPDCLLRTPNGIIPVELKRSHRPPARGGVYPNHMIQVLAYIVLVRERYGVEVPYGLVLYGDEPARPVYPTPENLNWLASITREIETARSAGELGRSHNQPGRCRGCGMRPNCNQSLC